MSLESVDLPTQAEPIVRQDASEKDCVAGSLYVDESQFEDGSLSADDRARIEMMETRLRELLAEGIAQCERGEFAEFSIDEMMLDVERDLEDEHD